MSIPESLLEISEYNGAGYKPVVDFGAWRVAVLNFIDELLPENLTTFQRHLETDEVFVLLSGRCILFLAEGDTSPKAIHAIDMVPGKMYNVKMSGWHTHSLSGNAKVLVIENRDTTAYNSPKYPIAQDQKHIILDLVRQLWSDTIA